jgi:hypothetical protein
MFHSPIVEGSNTHNKEHLVGNQTTQGQPDNRTKEEKRADWEAKQTNQKINPEATGTKPTAEGSSETTTTAPAATKEEKGGIINLVTSIPKAIWNKGLVPAYEFCKGTVTRAWGWCVDNYNAEVALYREMGPSKYFLDRGSKVLIKALKVVAIVTVAGLINTLLVNMTGISLFDPMTLAFVAVSALVLLLAKSYKDQKSMDDKASFSFKQAGAHIIESATAA